MQKSGEIEATAEYWIARRMSGSMTDPEIASMKEWLAASDANRSAMAELESLLATADEFSERLLAEKFEAELLEESMLLAKPSFPLPEWSVAAAVALFVVSAAIALFAIQTPFFGKKEERIIIATGIGELRTVSLNDGTEASLNSASHIEVEYTDASRKVRLVAGEAFFDVEKDKDRPFTVITKNASVTVTGTSFNVNAFENHTAIQVLTGVVDVTPAIGSVRTLLAGDMVDVDAAGRAGAVNRYDPALALAWRSGKARFRGAALSDVLSTLNRHFDRPITIDDENLSALPVTGEFDIFDRETAIEAITLTFGLTTSEESNRTVLSEPEAE